MALALAESAQQASTQPSKRPGASQAAPTNYGDLAVAAAEDRLPGSHSHVTLDKAYFPADRPAEQFVLQSSAPGTCDQLVPDAAAVRDRTHPSAMEPGEQLHQTDFQPHRPYLPGDPEKARIMAVPLTESQCDDHIIFPEDQAGKTTVPTVSFADQDQPQVHFYSGDQPPSYLGASVDKPHHPSQLADESPTPSNLPRDKIYAPSGSPEENTSTAPLAYMTMAPATADTGSRETHWDVAEQPTAAADFAAATLQRPHRTSRPLPPPPSQRAAEQLPAVGQVQAATSIGPNNSHKVRRGESQ